MMESSSLIHLATLIATLSTGVAIGFFAGSRGRREYGRLIRTLYEEKRELTDRLFAKTPEQFALWQRGVRTDVYNPEADPDLDVREMSDEQLKEVAARMEKRNTNGSRGRGSSKKAVTGGRLNGFV